MAVDLNHFEELKLSAKTDINVTLVKVFEMNIASALTSLTELVLNTRVAGECALAAFSLDPTSARFDVLVKLQERYETEQQITKTVSPLANLPSEEVDSRVDLNVEATVEVEDTRLYTEVDAERLAVSMAVIRDLLVVVRSCCWKVLAWRKGWKALAAQYPAYPVKMRNITKDLKFLKLDYTRFENIQREERSGIEKGYEIYYEDDGGASGASVARRPSGTKRKKALSSAPKKKKLAFIRPALNPLYILEELAPC